MKSTVSFLLSAYEEYRKRVLWVCTRSTVGLDAEINIKPGDGLTSARTICPNLTARNNAGFGIKL
eukprot:313737-Amorphochlora_amoeboformis.AAC.3